MSKEDLIETDFKSTSKFESGSRKSRPQSGPEEPKGARMKETPESSRTGSRSGSRYRETPANPKPPDPTTPTSSRFSYLSNPKVNFGSEIPHNLKSDANRLNTPSPPPLTTPTGTSSDTMFDRITYPYKLLRKFFANLPTTLYPAVGSEEQVNGKRDVGTLVQTISLVLNSQNIPVDEKNSASLKNFLEVPSTIEPLRVTSGVQLPTHLVLKDGSGTQQAIDNEVLKMPAYIRVEMLYPLEASDGEAKYAEPKAKYKTRPREEWVSSQERKPNDNHSSSSAGGNAGMYGSCSTTASSKSTNLFKVISKHVMSITSPGQSYDGNHASLSRLVQNQTNPPMFADSMFGWDRKSESSIVSADDGGLRLSNADIFIREASQNGLNANLSGLDAADLGEQNNARPVPVNVTNDLALGNDSKTITVLEMPNQVSLHNMFDEQYLSGKKKHSFYSDKSEGRPPSHGSASIDESKLSDEQEIISKSGSGQISELSSDVTVVHNHMNGHPTSKTSSDSLKNVKTECGSGKDTASTEMPSQLSLHDLFDEEYLTGRKKHSFSSSMFRRHISDDDDETGSMRRDENPSVLERQSPMTKHRTKPEKNANKTKATTKAQPLAGDRNSLDDDSIEYLSGKSGGQSKVLNPSVLDVRSDMSISALEENNVNEKGTQTKAKAEESTGSVRINFDESVRNFVDGESGRDGGSRKGESSSAQELRALISKHGLLNEKKVKKAKTAQPPSPGPFRINFDDSVENTSTSGSGRARKVKCPDVQKPHSSVRGPVEDKNVSGEKAKAPLERGKKHDNDIAVEESMPTVILYREQSLVNPREEAVSNKENTSSKKGNTFDVLIKQRADSITIEIIEPNSRDKRVLPLDSMFGGATSDDFLNVPQQQPKQTKGRTDSATTDDNDTYAGFDSAGKQHKSVSKYMVEELHEGNDSLKTKPTKYRKVTTGFDSPKRQHKSVSKYMVGEFEENDSLQTNPTEYIDTPEGFDSANRHRSISKYMINKAGRDPSSGSVDNSKDSSTDDADDKPVAYKRRTSSRVLTRARIHSMVNTELLDQPAGSGWKELPVMMYQSMPAAKDAMSADSNDSQEVSMESQSASVESDEGDDEASPEDSIDESGSSEEEDGDGGPPKSDSLNNWSGGGSSALSKESPTPPESGSLATDSLGEENANISDDGFDDSHFRFSQLGLPTTSMEDARLMKFLTTGSVKSSDVDEKLSEAHGHSTTNAFNKGYDDTSPTKNERNLNLGTKSSGHMPKPHEMLSIYSRGQEPSISSASDKGSLSSSGKIKPALRRSADPSTHNNSNVEERSSTKNVSRSVSFNEERQEFPWRKNDGISTPVAVTSATVETDSPMADQASKPDQDHGGRASTSSEVKTSGDATDDKNDAHGQPPSKAKSEDGGERRPTPPAAKRRSSSADAGKRTSKQKGLDGDANEGSIFSLENILPYMRVFFTPVMDEVALDVFHVLRGDVGCELCPQRRQEDEDHSRPVPRQEGGESGDEERKEKGDRRRSSSLEQEMKGEVGRRKSSRTDDEENEGDAKERRRKSSQRDQEGGKENEDDGNDHQRRKSSNNDQEKLEDEKKRDEDSKSHHEDEEKKDATVEDKTRT